MHRMFRTALILPVCVGVLAACASGGSQPAAKAVSAVPVSVGQVRVEAAGGPVELSAAQKDAVTAALSTYITSATAHPLQTGKLSDGLDRAFDPGALSAATGTDRATLTDTDLPAGPTTIAPVSADLTAVSDASNQVAAIAATVTVDASSKSAKGPIRVVRKGTYVFYPEGKEWKIHSYDVTVTRDLPDGLTTTTSAQR